MASKALWAFRIGSAWARAVPLPVADGVAGLAGRIAPRFSAARTRQVERNLRRVHGRDLTPSERRRGVEATYANYARYWVESFRLPGTPPEVLAAGIHVAGWEHVAAGLDAGKGVILALPHLGAWEWAGFWVAAVRQVPITVVVESLEPPDLYEWFVGLRESLGMHVVPLGPDAASAVLAALRANHVVCLLCDRDIAGSGVEIELFGERTTLPAGPATLAVRTGAALLPTACWYQESGVARYGDVRPPLDTTRHGRLREDVARITQDIAAAFESFIRPRPEQWHLLQPNWPSDHEAEALLAAGGRTAPP